MAKARGLRNILPGSRITNERTIKVSDFPNSSAGGAGSVRYINPNSLNKNPAFTNVVVVEGNVKTVHNLCSRGATAAGWLWRVPERLAPDAQPAGYHGGVRLWSCVSGLLGGDGRCRSCAAVVGREPNFGEHNF